MFALGEMMRRSLFPIFPLFWWPMSWTGFREGSGPGSGRGFRQGSGACFKEIPGGFRGIVSGTGFGEGFGAGSGHNSKEVPGPGQEGSGWVLGEVQARIY